MMAAKNPETALSGATWLCSMTLILPFVSMMAMKRAPAKTKLITRDGYNQLKAEHDELWFKKRPEVTRIVSWAASLGDRSENADYTYNKRLLRQIDSRIRYLRKRLEELQIVDYSPQQAGRVFFGAWVEVEDEQGAVLQFRIVGPDEIYGQEGVISIDAPMARALLKKEVDDEVQVQTPTGTKLWLINAISYQGPTHTDD